MRGLARYLKNDRKYKCKYIKDKKFLKILFPYFGKKCVAVPFNTERTEFSGKSDENIIREERVMDECGFHLLIS